MSRSNSYPYITSTTSVAEKRERMGMMLTALVALAGAIFLTINR